MSQDTHVFLDMYENITPDTCSREGSIATCFTVSSEAESSQNLRSVGISLASK